jgi:hypothetical protein
MKNSQAQWSVAGKIQHVRQEQAVSTQKAQSHRVSLRIEIRIKIRIEIRIRIKIRQNLCGQGRGRPMRAAAARGGGGRDVRVTGAGGG